MKTNTKISQLERLVVQATLCTEADGGQLTHQGADQKPRQQNGDEFSAPQEKYEAQGSDRCARYEDDKGQGEQPLPSQQEVWGRVQHGRLLLVAIAMPAA